jgi:hypothetical protein
MSLDKAIEILQKEVEAFGQGTSGQPKDGTAEWFLLRAKSNGLSFLKRLKQLGIEESPAASERFSREIKRFVKLEGVSSAEPSGPAP